MWHWVSCSDRRFRAAGVAIAAALVATPAPAKVFATREQALATAFGTDATVQRKAEYLDEADLARVRAAAGAGVDVRAGLVTRYAGIREGRIVGHAYLDTHRVRTLQETVMIVVGPDDRVMAVEVLAFGEPVDYLPKPGWLAQFAGRALDDELAVKRGIHGISGATLSADAVADAARRVLAVHRVLRETGR